MQSSFEVQNATKEDLRLVYNGIVAYNHKQVPFTQGEPFVRMDYVVKEQNQFMAGIQACMFGWGIVFIEYLFVEENHRHKKLGSFLLNKVEHEGKALGASLIHLDTFDFQAKDFYLKHGYEVFGVLADCPPGYKRYYLKKVL